ncbi:hypothetical protein Dimus_034983, partial [Dionaea muscipula]
MAKRGRPRKRGGLVRTDASPRVESRDVGGAKDACSPASGLIPLPVIAEEARVPSGESIDHGNLKAKMQESWGKGVVQLKDQDEDWQMVRQRFGSARGLSSDSDKVRLDEADRDIGREFIRYFKELLGTGRSASCTLNSDWMRNGPVLSAEQKDALSAPFIEKDVKSALDSIQEDKAL